MIEPLIREIMSQENVPSYVTSADSPAGSSQRISITLNTPLPNIADWEHVVISLSLRKQGQIMEGVGSSHSEQTPFSTWSVVGEALSNALLSESDGLYVQSATKIHRKDFLLFTRKKDSAGDGTKGILEIDFTQKLGAVTWQGHWQKARPQFVHVVRTSLEQFFKFEESRKQDALPADALPSDD